MPATSSKERRELHVDETNAVMRLSGFEPDAETLELQRRYVAGEVTAQDLLDWSLAFARKWMLLEEQDLPRQDSH